jgi:hypothetical protein
MLPLLLDFWHARLGELLSGRGAEGSTAAPAQDEAGMLSREPRSTPLPQMSSQIAEPVDPSWAGPATDSYTTHTGASYAGLFKPRRHLGAPRQPIQEEAARTSASSAPGTVKSMRTV